MSTGRTEAATRLACVGIAPATAVARRAVAPWLARAFVAFLVLMAAFAATPGWAKARSGGTESTVEAAAAEILRTSDAGKVEAVLARLTDEQVRQVMHLVGADLLRRNATGGATAGAQVLESVANLLTGAGGAWAGLPGVIERKASEARTAGRSLAGLVRLEAALICATVGIILLVAARSRGRRALTGAAERRDASGEAPSGIASAIATEAAGIAAFIAGWFIAWWLQAPFGPEAKAFLAVALSACLMVAVPVALANALLGRSASGRRRVAMDDGLARDLYRVVAAACGLIAAIFVFAQTLGILGAPRESALMVGGSLSPVIWLCMGWLVWRYRAAAVSAVTYALAADDRWGRSFARAWMPVAVVFLAVVWLLAINAMMRDQGGVAQKVLATFALPALVVALGAAARRAVDRSVARASTTTAAVAPTPGDDDQPVAQPTAGFAGSPGAGPLMRAIWLALGLGAIVVIGGLWGLRPAHFGLGGWLLVVTGELVGLLLVGYIVWGLIGLWVLMLHVRLVQSGGNPNAQRYMTLLPLFRRFLQIAIFTLGIMIGLSAIGLDIGPLLASAGVIGIAIGLGAQSTISDILAGVFFLLEDAFRVGDYVEVGNIRGTVEGISLRALRLRHHRGAVHVLPFGQIKALTNTSRDWMLIRLEFSVAPDSDLQKIKKIVKGIGADLLKDPQYTQEFIVPIKSQGVRRIEDNALIIGVKYIAKPGAKVWMIRREAYQRIRDAFSKEGVRMASREVTVRVDRDGATVDDAAAAAAGGASAGRSGPT